MSNDKFIDDVILSGSTWAAIWHMTWPLLLQMSSISVASFCDVWVAGKLGSQVQAAIGICGQVWFFMMLMTVALSVGTTAIVSRHWGARDIDTARLAARQSVIFAVLFGSSSAIAGLIIARWLLGVLGASPEVQELGWQYLRVDLLSQLPFTIIWVCHSIWRAIGNSRTPMMNWLMMVCVIIILDFTLCLNPLHLGVSGIAWAWVAASCLGVISNVILLRQTELADCVRLRALIKEGVSKEWLLKIFTIGIPACITDLAWVGGCFALFLIFARTSNPTACQASWAIGFRLEEVVSCLPVYALAAAVSPIVGQNLGAKQADRAERAGWQVTLVGVLFTSVVAFLLFFGAEWLARLMSSDEKVVEFSKQYFQVVGLSQPFVALWLILFGAMQGAGYTAWPMWAGVLSMTLLRLPLAWILTTMYFDGPMGCWIGLAITSVILGLVATWRYKTGVWKLQKV